MAVEIITSRMPCEVFLSAYTAGKEELAIELAKEFKTLVWVEPERYIDMQNLGLHTYFTLDESAAWIFLNKASRDEEDLKSKKL